jgi:hypothetical protein
VKETELGELHQAGNGTGGLVASIAVAVGQAMEDHAGRPAVPKIPWAACHPVPITGAFNLSAGAGVINSADNYGPKDPYWWDLRSLGVWGFTAGTVTVNLNSPNGQQLASATTPGEFDWSAQRLLGPRDWMVFTATGITGTVQFGGQAIEILSPWLPEYLM